MPRKKRKKRKDKKKTRNILTVIVVLLLTIFIGYWFFIIKNKQSTSFDKSEFTVKGIDLSHHNPIIDWGEVGDHDISFVYLKATGGIKHSDRNYRYNYEYAKKSNIKVGSYHFYLFGISGREQAQHFIKTSKYTTGDLYPAIDVEHSGDNIYSKDSTYTALVIKELEILENEVYEYYGVHPILYTNRDCYKLYIKDNFPDNMIWMCDLHKEPEDVENWVIWQFSHKGELDGVIGDIDLNYYRFSYEQLHKILIP